MTQQQTVGQAWKSLRLAHELVYQHQQDSIWRMEEHGSWANEELRLTADVLSAYACWEATTQQPGRGETKQ